MFSSFTSPYGEHNQSYVRVRVRIPDMKSESKGWFGCIRSGEKNGRPKNAEIECDFGERSFSLTVTGDSVKKMKNKNWALSSDCVPLPIDPERCYWKTEDNFVNIFLKKADEDDNWSKDLWKWEI